MCLCTFLVLYSRLSIAEVAENTQHVMECGAPSDQHRIAMAVTVWSKFKMHCQLAFMSPLILGSIRNAWSLACISSVI